jgi:outer membrane immunogenic protein
MKRTVILAMLMVIAAKSASAADLPQAPPPPAPAAYAPAVVPIYNWGGVYVGINGGWTLGTAYWSAPGNASASVNANGGIVGGTLGANWQTDAFIFGLEADIDYSTVSTSTASNVCAAGANCQAGTSWLSTMRARLGYADDRLLFYGTAGAAVGNMEMSANGVTNTTTRLGWTAGGGVELAISDNWTGRLEYLYADFKPATCSSVCGGSPVDVRLSENLIRAGVDFKFRP